jgi:SPP1 family predicted phage head-tail adaptor
MSIPSGILRRLVDIEDLVTAQDSSGDITQSWQTFAEKVPAAVEPLSGRELIRAQSMQSEITARITIRFKEGVKATMRVLHRGQIYRIHAVLLDKVSGRAHITLMVSELAE